MMMVIQKNHGSAGEWCVDCSWWWWWMMLMKVTNVHFFLYKRNNSCRVPGYTVPLYVLHYYNSQLDSCCIGYLKSKVLFVSWWWFMMMMLMKVVVTDQNVPAPSVVVVVMMMMMMMMMLIQDDVEHDEGEGDGNKNIIAREVYGYTMYVFRDDDDDDGPEKGPLMLTLSRKNTWCNRKPLSHVHVSSPWKPSKTTRIFFRVNLIFEWRQVKCTTCILKYLRSTCINNFAKKKRKEEPIKKKKLPHALVELNQTNFPNLVQERFFNEELPRKGLRNVLAQMPKPTRYLWYYTSFLKVTTLKFQTFKEYVFGTNCENEQFRMNDNWNAHIELYAIQFQKIYCE